MQDDCFATILKCTLYFLYYTTGVIIIVIFDIMIPVTLTLIEWNILLLVNIIIPVTKMCWGVLRLLRNWADGKPNGDQFILLIEKEKENWSKNHDLEPTGKKASQLQKVDKFKQQLKMCYRDVEIYGLQFKQYYVTDGIWQIEFSSEQGVTIHDNPMFAEVTEEETVLTSEVMDRLAKVCGGTNYSLVLRNSEHLCRYICTGAWISYQMAKNGPIRKLFDGHMTFDNIDLINTMPSDLKTVKEQSNDLIYTEVGDYYVKFCKMKEALTEADNDDFNILILGPTGSGKSTLINHLFNQNVVKTLGSAASVTQSMAYTQGEAMWNEKGKWKKFDKLNIIDSVGFCDTALSEKDVSKMIKSSVNVNLTYIDKVVIITSGRIEEPHARAIKQFMKWLSYKDYKNNFVFIYNKTETLTGDEKQEILLEMSSILGSDLGTKIIDSSCLNKTKTAINLNLALGFSPSALFEEVETNLISLKSAIFSRDMNSKRIPINIDVCAMQ